MTNPQRGGKTPPRQNNQSRKSSPKTVAKQSRSKPLAKNQAPSKHTSSRQRHSASASKAVTHREKTVPSVESFGVRQLTIDASFSGQRIDNYLRRILPNLPKSRLYQMLRKGEVRLNKKRVKPESRITEGDILRIPPITIQKQGAPFVPEKALARIKKAVLYRDEHFMVIDKPAGIAVHGGSKNQYGVIDVIRQAFADENWELCHRLDKDTSGCLVLGCSREALNTFQDLSMSGKIHKQYLALVKGSWVANEWLIDTPIEKTTVSRMNAQGLFERVDEGGDKEAISIFTTREHYAKSTLMQVLIKTGKTHQIRVHSALNKHPIAMDDKYGDFKWNRALEKLGLPRMFLHAHVIRFEAFDEIIHVSAVLPDDLQGFIDAHC